MAVYRVLVARVLEVTGATCTRQNIYRRLSKYKERQKNILCIGHSDDNVDDDAVGGAKGERGRAAADAPIKGGDLTPPPPPSAGSLSAAEVELGLKDLPPGLIQRAVQQC